LCGGLGVLQCVVAVMYMYMSMICFVLSHVPNDRRGHVSRLNHTCAYHLSHVHA
jgi:hypothetical protein